jgi:hypothetical protein
VSETTGSGISSSQRSLSPWSHQAKWRGHYGIDGVWISGWPEGVCKECGMAFRGTPQQRYCTGECRRRAHSRSNNHAARARKWAKAMSRKPSPYHVIGKSELHHAFRGLCALCQNPVGVSEAWVGHRIAVSDGGQHTRENIAPVHKACENDWTWSGKTPRFVGL